MNASPHQPIVKTALYQEVAERLRQRIFAHELAPGSWLDEQALAEAYGISRTPLREALKVLASEGLVVLKPRQGCYVAEVLPGELDDIFPVLALLEAYSARDATLKLDAAGLARLESLHKILEDKAAEGDLGGFFEANQRFHRALHELTGNSWLLRVIDETRKRLKLARHQSLLDEGRIARSLAEHRQIMSAIRGRKALRAEELMHQHLLRGQAATREVQTRRVGRGEKKS
jgi:DNA-binding GntR family transcriptional regulator